MSDFDFDELDKAVAGAISPDELGLDTPATTTTPVSSPAATDSPSQPDSIVPPRGAPAARRSSGRFMDVVHPSSDMRTRPTFTPPQPSTQAASASEVSSVEPKVAVTEDQVEAPAVNEDELSWDAPLESPFLPDAKVEKRPLGGAPDIVASPLDFEEDNEVLKLEAPDDPLLEATTMPDPIDFAAQAAALHTENEDTSTVTTEQETVTATAEPEASKETVLLESEQIAPEFETPALATEPDEAPAGPSSITQQYTEQPSEAQASGAIYDTENYHQALPAAAKKKSGAWIILWIALLVVFGTAAGVAFYLFVLPLI